MILSKDQAKDMAICFREMSVAMGNYRFDNWDDLSEKERILFADMEWTLLNYSSDFITQAVGLILNDSTASLAAIKGATAKAKRTINKVNSVKRVLAISSSVIGLGAALVIKDPGTIACAINNLIKAAED